MTEFSSEHDWLSRHLPPNFKIEQTNVRDEADFVVNREGGEHVDLEKLIGAFVMSREDIFWPLQPEYRSKRPAEQWELNIGEHAVQLYNYVPWRRLSDDHAQTIVSSLASFESAFPGGIQNLRAVTVVDHLKRSPYGDPKRYPAHAEAQLYADMFALQGPQALRLHDRYRRQLNVNSLSAVVAHEMTHLLGLDRLLAADFEEAGFTWSPMLTPVTQQIKTINGHPVFRANQPEACVTSYGVLSAEEDACESVVAYLYAEPSLHSLKKQLISYYDQNNPMPSCAVAKADEPGYPLLPEHFSFFLES